MANFALVIIDANKSYLSVEKSRTRLADRLNEDSIFTSDERGSYDKIKNNE